MYRRFSLHYCILAALTLAVCGAPGVAVPTASKAAPISNQKGTPVTRTYYIAADEVEWDYAPSGVNLIAGRPFNDEEKKYMEPGPTLIGRRLKKAQYREYTDGTFKTLKP